MKISVEKLVVESNLARLPVQNTIYILVDVLRASTTIITAFYLGARKVIPVNDDSEFNLLDNKDIYLKIGEQKGKKLPFADINNSPSELIEIKEKVKNKLVYIKTTNATRVLNMLKNVTDHVYIGAMVNKSSVVRKVFREAEKHNKDIKIIAVGRENQVAEEDVIVSNMIEREMIIQLKESSSLNGDINYEQVILNSESSKNLIRLGYQKDVEFCCRENVYNIIPMWNPEGFFYSEQK